MRLTLNGEARDVAAGSVADLLGSLKLEASGVAVEVDGLIVPRAAHATTPLRDGSVIEIVELLGGG